MTRHLGRALCFIFLLHAGTARADVHLPGIFGDHMVLEQDGKIPVWGTADTGEAITVALADHAAKATADANGKWRVDLDPLPPTATPLTLTVTGKTTVKFADVLIGDVWLCSGQSNMSFALNRAHNADTEIPKADDPQLRFFTVASSAAFDPQTDVKGRWEVSAPGTVPACSAVAYFFGRELRHDLSRPIGLIVSSVPGMPAQAFTSLDALQQAPPFANYVREHQIAVQDFPINQQKYPAALAAYQDKLKAWQEAAPKAGAGDVSPSPPAAPATPMPHPPVPPGPRSNTPSVLFNGMIAPLIPYAIKGAIWYQGEANAANGLEYQTLFPRMIADWRARWGEGDFPFLYVQLANYGGNGSKGFPLVREAQLKTLSVPNTGMAVIIDIGNPVDIHPKDKLDVGLRLALAARHVAYKQELVYSGPIYDTMKIEGGKIRVTFTQTGSGLQMSAPPWTPTGQPPPAPTSLTGFAIAGADQKWVDAQAQIDGNTIVVSSDEVTSPVAVRYGWAPSPACNLYNKEGLLASPFRSDDWNDPKP